MAVQLSRKPKTHLGFFEFQDEGQHILVARCARFNSLATCVLQDVVLLRDGPAIKAGRVQLHFDIAGECVSLMQVFALLHRRPGTALSVWRVTDDPAEC